MIFAISGSLDEVSRGEVGIILLVNSFNFSWSGLWSGLFCLFRKVFLLFFDFRKFLDILGLKCFVTGISIMPINNDELQLDFVATNLFRSLLLCCLL